MIPLLSECWRWTCYLLRPEDGQGRVQAGPDSALAGMAKTLFWAFAAVLAGFGLARLKG